ncbi:hypothetical protein [Streptomyces sp. ISL-86]|uniref:hypothetical protein n=1 Tax=Streptomyces sp. ISL-86 TaxID=2819187 RepID=UPI001BE70305|nr:hypothetical protein [Streptomyces sp. ISL-86]MBT2454558.1 hypothetical protein [Streptomyces sp. ISL-86]
MISLVPADPHSSTTCADWGRAHDAGAEAVVLEELEAVRNEVYRAWEKPGRCVEALQYRARRLPHPHLPWFWDTVGHRLAGISARYAGRAYALARKAEQEHGLPVDAAYRQANARLFARRGALPAKELSVHQAWLAETLEPVSDHREFTAFLADWVASPGDLPADLVRRIRASTRAAGLGAASPHRPQRAGMERVDRCTAPGGTGRVGGVGRGGDGQAGPGRADGVRPRSVDGAQGVAPAAGGGEAGSAAGGRLVPQGAVRAVRAAALAAAAP